MSKLQKFTVTLYDGSLDGTVDQVESAITLSRTAPFISPMRLGGC
jgi:hypothetical protein